MKQVLIINLLLFLYLPSAMSNPAEAVDGVIKGKIVDANSRRPLEYVSVAIYEAETGRLITGTITKSDGVFRVPDIENGKYYVELSFMGYETQRVDKVELIEGQRSANIGILGLKENTESIEEVEVIAERAAIDYKIDKKIVNVSKQYTAVSGSAVNILENVPSMTVDIEGNVSMRGSSDFMVLIDGIPSVLEASEALQQIPASSIDNIEIITNPSAKYNPEGTGGIINIITKKNMLQGVNGVVNVNGGTMGYGGDFLFNYRQGKFGYYLAGDYNDRRLNGEQYLDRESYNGDETNYLSNDGTLKREMYRGNIRGGFDWKIDTMNTIKIDLNIGKRSHNTISNLNYSEWSNTSPDPYRYTSNEDGLRSSDMFSASATYLHKFNTDGHELKVTASNRSMNSKESNENQLYDAAGNKMEGRKSTEDGPVNMFQGNIDYSLPLGNNGKLESGYQIEVRTSTDETGLAIDSLGNGNYEQDPLYSNTTSFTNNIHALYTTYASMLGKFGYQLGLRAEYTDRTIELINSGAEDIGETKSEINRVDWFPTLHLSYKLPHEQELMTSYTRRIQRPRSYYLEPFVTWTDAFNVRQGNPDLLPEYIDALEIAYLKKWDKAFINFEAYYRVTHNKVEWIRSVYQDNIMMRSPENVGKDYSLGLDATFSFDPFKWWRADLSGSMYDYEVTGMYNGVDFSRSDFMWNARLNNTFKINKTTQIQAFTRYNSKQITAQGYRESFVSTDLAFRKEMFDRNITGVLQVRDVFNQNRRAGVSQGEDFYEYSHHSYNAPLVTLTVSYRFNNYKSPRSKKGGPDGFGGDEEF
ncbi:TonB-dependent receptor domain-containing protein [Saccharicrinis aurantiacus]|uniref:TonB-dependent receptor domain-containing protein n=1 Tax=Saccharicrinis aurantiacus TaxID=1849719 RepID=UPI00248FF0C4|nr:TonB-dependent receptor [Saccharicrinis aurantiacus]